MLGRACAEMLGRACAEVLGRARGEVLGRAVFRHRLQDEQGVLDQPC